MFCGNVGGVVSTGKCWRLLRRLVQLEEWGEELGVPLVVQLEDRFLVYLLLDSSLN